ARAALRRKADIAARVTRALTPAPLVRLAASGRSNLAAADRRLNASAAAGLERAAARLAQAGRLMGALSHQSVLERGFALVEDAASGALVKRAAELAAGQSIAIRFADGKAAAVAAGGGAGSARSRPQMRRGKPGGEPD